MLFCHDYHETLGGDQDVPMEPLQHGDEAAGLPVEGKFTY